MCHVSPCDRAPEAAGRAAGVPTFLGIALVGVRDAAVPVQQSYGRVLGHDGADAQLGLGVYARLPQRAHRGRDADAPGVLEVDLARVDAARPRLGVHVVDRLREEARRAVPVRVVGVHAVEPNDDRQALLELHRVKVARRAHQRACNAKQLLDVVRPVEEEEALRQAQELRASNHGDVRVDLPREAAEGLRRKDAARVALRDEERNAELGEVRHVLAERRVGPCEVKVEALRDEGERLQLAQLLGERRPHDVVDVDLEFRRRELRKQRQRAHALDHGADVLVVVDVRRRPVALERLDGDALVRVHDSDERFAVHQDAVNREAPPRAQLAADVLAVVLLVGAGARQVLVRQEVDERELLEQGAQLALRHVVLEAD
mmetsp:Transcript_22493/g.77156  ORF Transcript_22493/g.77156 Transcript_22493/m.77156 type:complete len:374 (-) Transcript_22493:2365-3486(-)